ncbi:MAG: ATP-binding protein [Deltaproteobacteria bacterium]|nr:ATP-binding protein [Deltaproteobacteria bacterium]
MRELSLHILDIMENSLNAGATRIDLSIEENRRENRLRITIGDNGPGIAGEVLDRVLDPFFTTRTTRRVGLGLSLFREASRRCGGRFRISSEPQKGTEVEATFQMDHIDLAPLGDMAGTLTGLILGNPEVDLVYRHETNGGSFHLDTREIREELEEVPIQHPEVLRALTDLIRRSLSEIRGGGP